MTAEKLLLAMRNQGLSLVVAESCTGGLLGAEVSAVPGCSDVYLGGVIAYGESIKDSLLGVKPKMIKQYGAVSGAVVEAMAHGIRDRTKADVAIAISGVAGPTGGRSGKEIGTVWIAVLGPGHLLDVHRVHIDGDREAVRHGATAEAIAMALDVVGEAKLEA